ncbi:MAG: class I SAM-dependent methyltransferase [Pseudomonadota bacterium]
MTAASGENPQSEVWNGIKGLAWVEAQVMLDRMFQPFADMLVDRAAAAPRRHVLDVGCGTGAVTMALARTLGSESACTGIDISEPMLAAARARAEAAGVSARFVKADAESYAFEPGGYDLIVSRFGVMFFADPVAAFSNLNHAAQPGGEFAAVAWRSPAENEFMTTAGRAAAPYLPETPRPPPDAPGQFGFSDAERVRAILEQSHWRDIKIEPVDAECHLALRHLDLFLTKIGPLVAVLPTLDAPTREEAIATARAAFEPYVDGDDIVYTAACWMISARAKEG